MRKYHLSYDAKNLEEDFDGSSNEARDFILCVLSNTKYLSIESFNNSTFIITYEEKQSPLFNYLQKNLQPRFYYSISLIAFTKDTNNHYVAHSKNLILNKNLQGTVLTNLNCDKFKLLITKYP